jgi:allantoinase
LFGVYPQKGAIAVGCDADLVIVDLDREWTLSADQLFYKNKHSAFVGYSFKGAVDRTFVRGQTVYHNGRITVEPGFGQAVRRTSRYAFP